jgi:hypothetical protein
MAGSDRGFPDYDKTFAYYLVCDGDALGKTVWAETLEEVTEADGRPGCHVVYVEEGFFAYEHENGNRLAWRVRGRVRRRLWAGDLRRREAEKATPHRPPPDRP